MPEWKLELDAERVLREVLEGFQHVQIGSRTHWPSNPTYDLAVDAVSGKASFRFIVEVKSRVTPQTALSVCEQLRAAPKWTIPVVFAPTISPRVADILRQRGIGYVDGAGNCWLQSTHHHLLIERQGLKTERLPTPAAADPFSRKSSRIVRALLSRPEMGWQVRKLAEDPNVQVSAGLVVKVKQALVEENYAFERQRLLYLRDPIGLLETWSQRYKGPAEQIPMYVRGDAENAEKAVDRWCSDNGLQYALAGYSAAWRFAPEVLYTAASVYVEDDGFKPRLLDTLDVEYGAKRVSTGPNLYLWRPFDQSVFVGKVTVRSGASPTTSALQTYLDLKQAGGRGEDAANAVFENHLRHDLEAVEKREVKRNRG